MLTTLRLLLLLMLGLFGFQPVGYAYDAPGNLVSGAQNIVAASPEIGTATAESAALVPLNFNRAGAASGTQANFRTFSNFVAAESGGSRVIAETLAGKGNILSKSTLTADEALTTGEQFVGPGYSEIGKPGSGVFRSGDGLRQFRMDNNSILGNHAPDVPHVHFELYPSPTAPKPLVNNHVPFIEP